MTKKREPTFTTDNLISKLLDAWKTRGPLRSDSNPRMGRSKDRALIEYLKIDHVLWFEEEKSATQHDGAYSLRRSFFDHIWGSDEINMERVRSFVISRLEGLSQERRKVFNNVYGGLTFGFETNEYKKEKYSGVLIKAPVVKIPVGRQDRLSDNLFEYAYNVITLPATRALIPEANQVDNDVWYKFFGNENFPST